MGKFDGIYLVSDLDGTLLSSNAYGVSEENIAAIKYFMAEGGRFGFATGRTVNELYELHELIGTNAPSITCNGSKIYNFTAGENRIIDEAKEDILPFLDYVVNEYPNVMIEMVSDSDIYYYRPNSSLEKHKSITNSHFREISHYSLIHHPWMKIAIWDEAEAIKKFAETVDRSKLPENYNFMYSFKYCCEISTFTADKGVALLEAKNQQNGICKAVAIGDNENDVLMLKNADISFVPSNAVPMAKECADIILDADCNNSAVALAIKKLEEMIFS